jgi:hypothetical protein
MTVDILAEVRTNHLPSTGLEPYRYVNLALSIMAQDQYISQKSCAKNTPWPLSASFILKPNILINADRRYKALLCYRPNESRSIPRRIVIGIKTSSIMPTIFEPWVPDVSFVFVETAIS